MNKIFSSMVLLILLSCPAGLNAQGISLARSEDSIRALFARLVLSGSDQERFKLNAEIDQLFGEILKTEESISYPFDKLMHISKLNSEDGQLRVINWNINLDDGSFLYYAYIMHKDKHKKYQLFRLEDKSENINDPEYKELSEKNWYGALYYKIVATQADKNTYYTLLGWDGNNDFTNKKIIETFYISGKKLVLGPAIFKTGKSVKNRLIFEYAEQAKMMLRYDEQLKMIVFDHLVPTQKKLEGQYMFYGPDMSQDGIQFANGFWEMRDNLDLRNLEDPKVKTFEKSY